MAKSFAKSAKADSMNVNLKKFVKGSARKTLKREAIKHFKKTKMDTILVDILFDILF